MESTYKLTYTRVIVRCNGQEYMLGGIDTERILEEAGTFAAHLGVKYGYRSRTEITVLDRVEL